MKKNKDILVGIMVGVLAFVSLLVLRPLVYQYQYRAIAESIEDDPFLNSAMYNEINGGVSSFSPYSFDIADNLESIGGNIKTMLVGGNPSEATYKNMYGMMFLVGVKDPEETAIVDIASSYNITPLEAADIMNGALGPVKRLLPGLGNNMTQSEIFFAAAEFRREFNDLYEIYQLKQELMTSSQLSELFSNGDLSDSGFDLVEDLSKIEKVLFDVSTPIESVDLGNDGDPSADDIKVAYSGYHEEEPLVPEISYAYYALDLNEEGGDGDVAEDVVLEEFDAEDLVEYIEEDVCPPEEEDPLTDALDEYDDEIEEYFEENEPDPEEEAEEEEKVVDPADIPLEEELIPEEASDWKRKEECNGMMFMPFGDGSTETSEGTEGGVPIADVEFYICMEYSEKWEVYKSFVPAEPCFACEFEKILAYMNKTISASLLPNKVTGNLFESALCKKGLIDALSSININFQTVFAPVETPPDNDAIFGKSIFEEWGKFIEKNNPLGLQNKEGQPLGHSLIDEYENSRATQWVEQNIDSDEISDYINQIAIMQQQMTRDAADEVALYSIETIAQDYAAYSESILQEVGQMTEYFKAFAAHFEKIAQQEGFCKSIKTKKVCE